MNMSRPGPGQHNVISHVIPSLLISCDAHCGWELNKLKSLKVAQVKDEMDGDEDDGCDIVCDVVFDDVFDDVCDVVYEEV